MKKINVRGRDLSLHFILMVGVLLLVGVAALAFFVRTGGSIRRHDPKAVMLAPAGARPERLLSRTPETPGEPQVKVIKHPKLSTPLATLARAVPQDTTATPQGEQARPPVGFAIALLPKSVRDAVHTGMMHLSNDGYVQVYIRVSEISGDNLQALKSAGATLELHESKRNIVQARVPANRLEAIAALSFVKSIRLPEYGFPNVGSVTTEGDAILNADDVRNSFGVDGTGVTVGVISDGIAGIFATGCTTCGSVLGSPLDTGDLPISTGIRNAGVLTSTSGGLIAQSFRADGDLEAGLAGAPTGAEGTAMLEIVHDLAPGAQLRFANFATSLEFNQAVDFLADNSDVVIDDIGFFGAPYDGTSSVSANTGTEFNDDTNPIRAYFTAVGNEANKHYQDTFVDSTVDGQPFTGLPGNLHLFQSPGTNGNADCFGVGSDVVDAIFLFDVSTFGGAGSSVDVFLVWNDPFGASGNDYDLFLLRSDTLAVVAQSIDPQDGNDLPVEFLSFSNTTGLDQVFFIVIQNFNNLAAFVEFDMFIRGAPALGGSCTNFENNNFNTVFSSVPAQSDSGGTPVSVMSAGAIDAADPLNDDIEFFSSNGPTNDGRLKPDGTAIDGVSITGAGGFGTPFFGTSAAAPHGAGIAALLLQSAPCLLDGSVGALADPTARQTLRDLILNNAVDLGAAGSDQVFGFGRIDALASANQTTPTANAGSDQTVTGTSASGASVTLDGTSSSDPNSCPLTFTWAGGCGTASASTPTVTCPFGTSSMNLTVTNNGVTLSSGDSVVVTVTDFTVGVSPASATVNRGQLATYNVTLTPQFGAFDNAISLSCSGLPSLSSCSFSPASSTPGGSQVTSTLTVSTTAPSASLWPPGNTSEGTLAYASWLGMPGLALFGLTLVGRVARRRGRFWLLIAALVSLLALQVACGGDGGTPPPLSSPGTPTGTSTITITGTSGMLQRSTTATLTVQ